MVRSWRGFWERRRRFSRNARRLLRLSRSLAPHLVDPKTHQRRVFLRLAVAGFGLLALAVAAYWLLHRPEVSASSFNAGFEGLAPKMAIDGDVTTEWLLENAVPGWLEVRFSRRRISEVAWVNSRNVASDPRATRDYRVELWSGPTLVASTEGTMAWDADPKWQRAKMSAERVDHIRFEVRSYHFAGGGLAELAWR